MGLKATLDDFISQSSRVLNITHKPGPAEFRQIAIATGIGIAVVGAIGFVMHTIGSLFRGI